MTSHKPFDLLATDIYDEMKALGVEMANHESDLYVKDSPEVRALLAKYPTHERNVRRFIHSTTNAIWIDIPFAYAPFWRDKAR